VYWWAASLVGGHVQRNETTLECSKIVIAAYTTEFEEALGAEA